MIKQIEQPVRTEPADQTVQDEPPAHTELAKSTEPPERKDLWLEVERIVAEWSAPLSVTHPPFPLERLRPLWNSNHRLMANDHLKLETLARENMLLKFELTQLRQQLERVTGVGRSTSNSDRRRADRRAHEYLYE